MEDIKNRILSAKEIERVEFNEKPEIVKAPIDDGFGYQPEYTGWTDITITIRIKE